MGFILKYYPALKGPILLSKGYFSSRAKFVSKNTEKKLLYTIIWHVIRTQSIYLQLAVY